ncbi:Amidase [Trema orientale]|uniref:Amidase n=1 Tax=Trema orientale TaxID=63057 RepID=A0A2P5EWV9_TREOI|nr:Amidase [Trema orientale]
MSTTVLSIFSTWPLLILLAILSSGSTSYSLNPDEELVHGLPNIVEATVDDIRLAFEQNKLTSRQLVEFYLGRIKRLNPVLKGVIEINPDALYLADKADQERKRNEPSHVPRDAPVVTKLRKAGAIILGKASLSEWSGFRGNVPPGWSARGGQGRNPYDKTGNRITPCGSSSGSAISASANFATVTLGTETDESILCPSSVNSVVGIKPTIGLTSRTGVVPISPRQDTVGTVADATYVLDSIAGIDINDKETIKISKYIPKGGYAQFLRRDGLKGKRVGVVRHPYFEFNISQEIDTILAKTYEQHLRTLRYTIDIL